MEPPHSIALQVFFGDLEHPATYFHRTYESGLVRFVLG